MEQLGLISAVLGGFAFTFLSALVSMPSGRRSVTALFFFAVLASAQFFVCALGWSLLGWSDSPNELAGEHRLLSLFFVGGIVALTTCIGVVGWLRSASMGIATTMIAVAGLVSSMFVVRHFIS
ncbi:MAG: hypothetical protein AAGH76_17845 [Pseudomonadota bacterium]